MPGNTITINGVQDWYVGDSKMEELIEWLKKNGFKETNKKRCCQEEVKK